MIGNPIGTIIKIIERPSKTKPAKKTRAKIRINVPHFPKFQNSKIPRTASNKPYYKKTLANIVPPTTIVSIIAVTDSVLIIASNITERVNVL